MGQEGARGRGRPRVERAPRGRASPSHTRASCARARAPTCVRACVCVRTEAAVWWTGGRPALDGVLRACLAARRGGGGRAASRRATRLPAALLGLLDCPPVRRPASRQGSAGQGREDVLTPLPSDPPPPWHPPPRTACTTLRSGVRARHERGAAVRACVPAGGRRGRAARDGLRAGQARPGRRAGAVCACEARRRGRGALCRRRRHRRRRYAHRFAAHQEGRAARAARCATRRRGARLGPHDACRGARAGGRASGPRLWLWRRHLSLHL